MGCCGSKKPKNEDRDYKSTQDGANRASTLVDPRSNRTPGATDPWEKPNTLPSPYPQGKIAVDQLLNEEDIAATEDIAIQKEIVPEQMIGKLVKESQIKA